MVPLFHGVPGTQDINKLQVDTQHQLAARKSLYLVSPPAMSTHPLQSSVIKYICIRMMILAPLVKLASQQLHAHPLRPMGHGPRPCEYLPNPSVHLLGMAHGRAGWRARKGHQDVTQAQAGPGSPLSMQFTTFCTTWFPL